MPTIATRVAAAPAAKLASCQALKPTTLLAPSIASCQYKDVIVDGCIKVLGAHKRLSSSLFVACKSNLPVSPELPLSMSSQGPNQLLHSCSSKEKIFSHLSTTSISFFGNQDGLLHGIPRLPVRRSSLEPARAYKNDFFRIPFPVLAEKPEWWWRTLACIPYLIALQISDAGYFFHPFLEYYDYLGDLI